MKSLLGKQNGAALLALIFVIVASASYLLVVKLNASTRPYLREQKSLSVLQEAKQALLAYAVTYPEQPTVIDLSAGPGHLPCPDTNDDGSPNQPCSGIGVDVIGRFPGVYLGVTDYEDSSGERLWYALSGNFKNNPKSQPLNSDTPGQLSVDGISDIVAVIIAPGSPTETQTGRPSSTISHYLEGENADGDAVFSGNAGGNDRLVYITRQELMRVIEKRVSGDSIHALKSYQADTGVFPWLNPFDPSPATVDYDAVVNTREGSLAFNDINEVFPTQFTISWDIRAGGNGAPFTLVPTATMADWNSFGPVGVNMESVFYDLDAAVTGPECKWITRDAINCVGRAQDPDPVTLQVTVAGIPIISVAGTRFYDFNVVIPSNGTASICAFTACLNSIRNRDVNLAADPIYGFPAGTLAKVTITDSGTINSWPWDPIIFLDDGTLPEEACISGICQPLVVVKGGSTTNTITTATDADIDIYDTTFDLGVGDELPRWFTANNWHKYVYAAYSAADVPDAAASPCVPGGVPACLTLQNTGPVVDDKKAIIIIAGQELPALGQDRSVSNALDAYFEDNNIDTDPIIPDDVFERDVLTTDFNDQARVVAP